RSPMATPRRYRIVPLPDAALLCLPLSATSRIRGCPLSSPLPVQSSGTCVQDRHSPEGDIMPRLAILALTLAATCALQPAEAAQSYDNCTGFIDSLPATITRQGTWCLRKDLSTSITSGAAITITANNATIDCNDYKIGGLGAGSASQASGISAVDRQNATIRHCNVRGFYSGIDLLGGAGHLVEDNRLDNNLRYGIHVIGDNGRVRRNAVYDTGGAAGVSTVTGIYAYADIVDN